MGCRTLLMARSKPPKKQVSPVGARLARDEDNAVLQKPRRLFREQALLPPMQERHKDSFQVDNT